MRFAVCLLLLACVSYAAAFFPFLPPYKCVEDKTCVVPRGEPATELNGAGIPQDLPVLRIRQRLPRDDLPHDIRIGRYLERLVKKFEHASRSIDKRTNNYPFAQAVTPTQPNSLALSQDGTDFSYFAQIKFGSNGTPLWMLMDTGASATWVMGNGCTSAACLSHNTYGAANSTSFQGNSGAFDIAYGTGHVTGTLGTDTVSFAGFSLSITFGVANQTSDDFVHFPFDGIMGLARNQGSYPTVLEALSSSKASAATLFGVNIDRNSDGGHDGAINFGAPDTSKYSGNLGYTPLANTEGAWIIPADGVGIDGKSAGISGRNAYIDTGTSYIFIPPADAKAVHSLIAGSQLSPDGRSWYVPCATTSPIQFTFSGTVYDVSPQDWIGGKNGGSLCVSNIYPGTPVGGGNWLLGDTFMKNVYTVFDSGNNRIGFGAKSGAAGSFAAASSSSSAGSQAASSSSSSSSTTSGSGTSNVTPTGSATTTTVTTPENSPASGFNAAITSADVSMSSASSTTPSPSASATAQGSASSRPLLTLSSISTIFLSVFAAMA